MSSLDIPVVLILFNRPALSDIVFAEISKMKPRKLYLIADGPRTHVASDVENCAAARQLANRIDWEATVVKDFSPVNLGCKNRIISGLNGVFAKEEQAIILEDDCIPHPSFFRFCDELLARYRDDRRIMSISGTNHLREQKSMIGCSYYFSLYNICWGWATWARAWKLLDPAMTKWPSIRTTNFLKDKVGSRFASSTWRFFYDLAYTNEVDSWAFRFQLSSWLNDGLSIIPHENLVSNVGFGDAATHSWNRRSSLVNMKPNEVRFPLSHPPAVERNFAADIVTQKNFFKNYPGWFRYLRRRLRKLLIK